MVNDITYSGRQSSDIEFPGRPPMYMSNLQKGIEERTALLLEDIPHPQEKSIPKSSSSNPITAEEDAHMRELQKIIEKIFNLSRIRREAKGKDPLTAKLCEEQIIALNDEADKLPSKYGVSIY